MKSLILSVVVEKQLAASKGAGAVVATNRTD